MWGGSPSAGIEGRCNAEKTTRGCPSNTLWLSEKEMKEKDEAHGRIYPVHKHRLHKHHLKMLWDLEISKRQIEFLLT